MRCFCKIVIYIVFANITGGTVLALQWTVAMQHGFLDFEFLGARHFSIPVLASMPWA